MATATPNPPPSPSTTPNLASLLQNVEASFAQLMAGMAAISSENNIIEEAKDNQWRTQKFTEFLDKHHKLLYDMAKAFGLTPEQQAK